MRRLVALVIACAVCPAQAAEAQVPERAVAVAGPTASGARLFAWDDGKDLCISVVRPKARGGSISCGGAYLRLRDPIVSNDGRRVWGVVSAEVAAVDVVLRSGRRLRASTAAGDRYRGRQAGAVRFFLLEARWARRDYPVYLRLLGENDGLLATAEIRDDGESHGRATVVARGRTGPARWALRAFTQPQLAPLPGDEERVLTQRCVELSVTGPSSSPQGGGWTCDVPDYPQIPLLDIQRTCGPVGIQIAGMARPGARLLAVLGDGARVRPKLVGLPRRFGGMRAYALVLPPDVALRSLTRIEDGKRSVEIGGLAPGTADCPATTTSYTIFGTYLAVLPRFGPEPPALKLSDRGVLLCATIGLPDPKGYDCGRPPLDEESSWVLTRATSEATIVAGVVPPTVATVEVIFPGGDVQAVPTAASAYGGRYQSTVRTFSLSLPGDRPPKSVRLIGADGTSLGSVRSNSPPELERPPKVVLSTAGGWRLAAGAVRFPQRPNRSFPCLELLRSGPPRANLGNCLSTQVVRVSCRPRATVVYGRVPAGAARVEVRTTDGTLQARTVSLRSASLPGHVYLAQLPRGAALRSLVAVGERTRRMRITLPPARDQCGYREYAYGWRR